MIKKVTFLGLALLVAGQLMLAQTDPTFQLIAVGAGGSETTFLVSNVQKIVFDGNTMTVKMVAGSDATGITCIKFTEYVGTGIIDQKSESSIFVFPNPVSETLTVNGVNKDAIINVYNMSGALMKTVISQENATNIDVSNLQQGIYLLRVDAQVIKFIKN